MNLPYLPWIRLALLLLIALTPTAARAVEEGFEGFAWHEVAQKNIEGQGWTDTEQPFDRLPARAKQLVRAPVWDLSRDSAGLSVRFVTDAASIAVRWTLNTEELAMYHMPATGVSGVDLYAKRGSDWHYIATGRATEYPSNEVLLISGLEGARTEYRLYLPLYNGVSRLEIGGLNNASFEIAPAPAAKRSPVVIYGTSITQGGCASRPGMSYPAILGRRLDVPIINLGFSGNGKAEPEMAHLLAELEPAAFVLDPVPNLFPDDVAQRVPDFIKILRKAHPRTPILLVESPLFPNIEFVAAGAERVNLSNDRLRKICSQRQADGDRNISMVPACDFTVDHGEATVDAIHPTDLGFVRLADSIEPYLRNVLD